MSQTVILNGFQMGGIKIGFLLGSLSGAGAEKTILTLSRTLQNQGCITEIYILNQKVDYPVVSTDDIYFLSAKSEKDKHVELTSLVDISNKKKPFDLFITSRAEFYDDIPVANKRCSVHITPTAWINSRGFFGNIRKIKKVNKLKKKFSNKKLIALSQGIKSDLVQNLGVAEHLVDIIHNPFNISDIYHSAKADFDYDRPYIVYVSSMIPRKRHMDLLKAFSNIQNGEVDLILVGKGPLEEELRQFAKELGISSRVKFWGWDANPYRIISAASLSVLVSEAEGMPRVLIESLLLNIPVVSTDCPSGPNEVLTDDLEQYLVKVGDIHALTKTIDSALEFFPNIKDRFNQRFSHSEIAKQYIELAKNNTSIA